MRGCVMPTMSESHVLHGMCTVTWCVGGSKCTLHHARYCQVGCRVPIANRVPLMSSVV